MSVIQFRRVHRRLVANLVANRKVKRRARTEHIARLGSVALPEPAALAERQALWADLDRRFAAVEARRPGLISPADRGKILTALDARIPRPTDAEEISAAIKAANRRAARKRVARTQPEPA
jgi:hypothetical protein